MLRLSSGVRFVNTGSFCAFSFPFPFPFPLSLSLADSVLFFFLTLPSLISLNPFFFTLLVQFPLLFTKPLSFRAALLLLLMSRSPFLFCLLLLRFPFLLRLQRPCFGFFDFLLAFALYLLQIRGISFSPLRPNNFLVHLIRLATTLLFLSRSFFADFLPPYATQQLQYHFEVFRNSLFQRTFDVLVDIASIHSALDEGSSLTSVAREKRRFSVDFSAGFFENKVFECLLRFLLICQLLLVS